MCRLFFPKLAVHFPKPRSPSARMQSVGGAVVMSPLDSQATCPHLLLTVVPDSRHLQQCICHHYVNTLSAPAFSPVAITCMYLWVAANCITCVWCICVCDWMPSVMRLGPGEVVYDSELTLSTAASNGDVFCCLACSHLFHVLAQLRFSALFTPCSYWLLCSGAFCHCLLCAALVCLA